MPLLAGVQHQIISRRFDMINFLRFEKQDAVGRFDQDTRTAGATAQGREEIGNIRGLARSSPALQLLARALQGFLEARLLKWLQKVVQCVDFKRVNGVFIVGGGENDRGHLLGRQGLQHLKAVEARHLDIEEHQVRTMLLNGLERLSPISALGDDLHIGLFIEKQPYSFTPEWLVVDDDGTNFHEAKSESWERRHPCRRVAK